MAKTHTQETVLGTKIPKNRMAEMLAHSARISGDPTTSPSHTIDENSLPEHHIDHTAVAARLNNARPNLLEDISGRINARRTRREGVDGTSPTPGQDNIDYVPPTTSMVTNPGELGGDTEGDDATPPTENRNRSLDLSHLFDEDHDDDSDADHANADDDEDDKDGKGKDDDGDDDNKDKKEEAVEVHCENCGYEETYNLSEADMEENPPPMTPDNKLDTTCPMCGSNMDFSLMGATDQEKIGDPTPFTDLQGHTSSEVPLEAITYANHLMTRVAEGEDVDAVAQSVLEADFVGIV